MRGIRLLTQGLIVLPLALGFTSPLAADTGGHSHGAESKHEAHGHAHHQRVTVDAATAPSLELSLEALDGGAWNLHLKTARFRFAREHVDQPHVAGEGHAHLYLDGKKIRRVFDNVTKLQALPPGVHEIKVGLFTNDHSAYAVKEREIADRYVLLVHKGEPGKAASTELKRFSIPITGDSVPADLRRIRLSEGDRVEIRWTSDAPRELHLHGYDVEFEVTPASPATLRFDATATGRFPVEAHGSHGGGHGHAALLHLEIYPR